MATDNPAKAAILVRLPGDMSLDDRDEFIEHVRELGACHPGANLRDMLLSWEAPDLWLLRGLVEDARRNLSQYWDYRDPFSEAIDNATYGSDDTNLAVMRYWVEYATPRWDGDL